MENSKKLMEMLIEMEQRVVLDSVASHTVISILASVHVKGGQKPSKTLNWSH